jgi:DNA-binding MarR family transcriptional regulator
MQSGSANADSAPFIVLAELWRGYQENPERKWSLAKLAKQSQLAMSTLRRHLNGLASAGLIEFEMNENGTGWAVLSEEGRALCIEAFGSAKLRD